jgi:hypothetical protein
VHEACRGLDMEGQAGHGGVGEDGDHGARGRRRSCRWQDGRVSSRRQQVLPGGAVEAEERGQRWIEERDESPALAMEDAGARSAWGPRTAATGNEVGPWGQSIHGYFPENAQCLRICSNRSSNLDRDPTWRLSVNRRIDRVRP